MAGQYKKFNIYVPLLIVLISSCSSKHGNDESLIKDLEKSLINSNISINETNARTLRLINDKLHEPSTNARAEIWFPRAEKISKLSAKISNYINTSLDVNESDKKRIEELVKELGNYKDDVLSIDSSIRIEFESPFQQIIMSVETNREFKSAFLNKIQNDIKVLENHLLSYCNAKIGNACGLIFDLYSPIVTQSRNFVKAGEKIEITAGVGFYSRASNPLIIINGKVVELQAEGFALYKFKAPTKVGNHTLPVTITYVDINTGKKEALSKNIEYTVAKECDQ